MTTNTAALLAEFRELNGKRPKISTGMWVTGLTPHEINQQEAARQRWYQLCDTHAQTLIESQAAEIAALRAELAETPPTLEWAETILGEPSDKNAHGAIWHKQGVICLSGQFSSGGYFLFTRAAVLAAVAKRETGQ